MKKKKKMEGASGGSERPTNKTHHPLTQLEASVTCSPRHSAAAI